VASYYPIQGMSGRSLRKLPFLAHAALSNPNSCDASEFLCAMIDTARREHSELPESWLMIFTPSEKCVKC